MEDSQETDLAQLKELSSPSDIVSAVLDLSRKTDGKVMVQFKDPKDKLFWFNPKVMQLEQDDPKSKGNIHAKLFNNILYGKWRITEIAPLEVDESQPLSFSDALEKFGDDNHFVRSEYAGLFREER